MVKFSLLCDQAHSFEAWFQSNESFETQQAGAQILCPHCASSTVRKALMAPNLASPKTRARQANSIDDIASEALETAASSQAVPAADSAKTAAAPQTVMQSGEPAKQPNMQQMLQLARQLHRVVAENCTDVGANFASEARKMHHGEAEAKPIYGTSTADEREALAEDGIPFAQLPDLPKDN